MCRCLWVKTLFKPLQTLESQKSLRFYVSQKILWQGQARAGKKERISEEDGHGAFQKPVATHTSAVLAGESQFLRVFGGFVEFGIVPEWVLLVEVHCFSENSKSYVILEVFLVGFELLRVVACAGAVFYENLVLSCVFSIDFEGWQVKCSCYAQTQCLARASNPLDDSSLLCFASDPAKTWRGWLCRRLGCPSGQLGRPFWRVTHHGGLWMRDFMYNFPNQFSLDKWKNIVCGFVRLRHSQPNSNFYFDVTQDLGYWRSTCQSHRYTVGGLGSEGDKTVLLGPKNWNPISSSKWTLLARHG